MIIRYSFENFHSFAARAAVSFEVDEKARDTDWLVKSPRGQRLNKVMAAIGANGSGKTTALKPICFMSWFISQSFAAMLPGGILPVSPHRAKADQPCKFELEFELDGRLWKYSLVCSQTQVLRESLDVKQTRYVYIFDRMWQPEQGRYEVKFKDTEFNMQMDRALETRPNCSIISAGAQYGIPLALKFVEYFAAFEFNVTDVGRVPFMHSTLHDASDRFMKNPEQKVLMERLLQSWDFGLTGVEITQINAVAPNIPLNMLNVIGGQVQMVLMQQWVPLGVHKSGEIEFRLPFEAESNGTRSAYLLLSRVLQTLAIGGVAIIDEIEIDLHPLMLRQFLDLFASETYNPKGAQLLCSTHSPEVLNQLDKHQVLLAEKNDLISECYRLDSIVGIRSDENLYAKYMAGSYGAIPRI